MKRLLREPLLHFFALGALLFAIHGVAQRNSRARPDEIVVSAGHVEHLAATFSQFHQRAPERDELQGLIDQYVHEEILSREAIKLGLDRDDTVIRRRLQQKMEFVATDLAGEEPPSEAELAAWYASHREDFRVATRFSFNHVYLDPERRGDRLDADASTLLTQLARAGAQAHTGDFGDAFLLPHEFVGESEEEIASQFGPDFAARLSQARIGEWTGPITSGFGEHLVLVTQRTEGRIPALDEVRAAAERDFMYERRNENNRRYFDALLAKYSVRVEWPEAATPGTAAVMGRTP